ncbi:MAG: hypothetical protein AB8G11_13590 [Saprospiraceae bacterium]
MFRLILVLLIFVSSSVTISAQKSVEGEEKVYPTVFQIGDKPEAFEELSEDYETGLLDVCEDDVKKAHQQWTLMLKSMEKHAKTNGFEINGVKMWVKVFWKKDGSIKHIAFHLKPTSKNVDRKALQQFLKSFAKSYSSEIKASKDYSQYSSASFPTLPQLVFDKE